MSGAIRSSTEDVTGPDGTTMTITVAGDRFPARRALLAAGHDAEAAGSTWLAEPLPVAHTVVVGMRGNRFGSWRRSVASAEAADALVTSLRAALSSGWQPADGDPLGL